MMHEAFRTFLYGFRHDAHPMAMMTGMIGSLAAFYHSDLNLEDPEAAPHGRHPPAGESADHRRRLLPLFDRLADPLSEEQPRIRRPLPAHDVRSAQRAAASQAGRRQGAGPAVHPARRSRAERFDVDRTSGRFHRRQSVRLRGRRRGGAVGPCARRRQRGGAGDAERDRPAGKRRQRHRPKPRTRSPVSV